MTASLTPNAIIALNSGEVELRPLLQVLDVKQIGTGQSVQERYRLVLSDGVYVQQAMLATQLNEYVKSGEVQKGSIVKLTEYICNTVQQRKIIIVLNMTVVTSVSDIIGNPKQVIMNDQTLNAAASAAGIQPKPPVQFPAQPQTPQPPQPQAYGSGMSSAYHAPQGPNVQQENPVYSKDGARGPLTPTSKPVQPTTGHQGQGYSPMGGNAASTAGGTHLNAPVSSYGKPMVAHSSYQPSPIYSNHGPIVKNEAAARVVPIAALNPYQGRWTIKARVTSKGDLRRYHNAKGEGKVFSFDLLDADGGEIRATCFNTVADQFYERIDVGNVYMISKGSLKPAQKNFNHLKNDWEIFLESSSTIERCAEEDGTIPQQQFSFVPINEIESMEANAMVDVVGVVVTINPSTTVMRKTGTEVQRRALQLRDMSGCSVEVTMWGTFCSNEGQQLQDLCDSGNIPVLAIKGGRLSDFGGKSIGTVSSTQLQVNPNLPQAQQVKDWFEKIGKCTAPLSISKEGGGNLPRSDTRKTISQIKDEGLGRSDKPDWIALRATISFIRTENFCYTACPLPVGDRQCNKKVINNGDGTWRCDRCDRAIAECDYRYLLSVQVQDHTGVTWITAFQEAGEEIMGVSAKELYTWKQDEDPRYRDVIQKLLFSQYIFKLKVKEENYNDELRVKCTAVKSERLDYASENKVLIDMIRRIARGEPVSGATSGVLAGSSAHVAPNYGGGGYSINANNGNDGYGHGTLHHGNEGYNSGMSNINSNSNKYGSRNFMDEKQMGYNASSNYGGGFGGGGVSGGQTNSCFKCGQGGHWARDCPGQGSVAAGGFGGNASYGGYGGNAGYGGNTRFGRGF